MSAVISTPMVKIMGRRQKGRQIDSILLLNKPTGISSNKALQIAKSMYFANKAGHTGALDPMQRACCRFVWWGHKFSQLLLDTDKTYVVRAKLVSGQQRLIQMVRLYQLSLLWSRLNK